MLKNKKIEKNKRPKKKQKQKQKAKSYWVLTQTLLGTEIGSYLLHLANASLFPPSQLLDRF